MAKMTNNEQFCAALWIGTVISTAVSVVFYVGVNQGLGAAFVSACLAFIASAVLTAPIIENLQ
jgi:uncharacterized membrane protein